MLKKVNLSSEQLFPERVNSSIKITGNNKLLRSANPSRRIKNHFSYAQNDFPIPIKERIKWEISNNQVPPSLRLFPPSEVIDNNNIYTSKSWNRVNLTLETPNSNGIFISSHLDKKNKLNKNLKVFLHNNIH